MKRRAFAMFEGTRLKIERARKHICDLNDEINKYLSHRPFRLYIKDEAMQSVWLIKTMIPIPVQVSIILGDAVHNLRAALDLLIFEMIGDKVANPESASFPFCKDASSFQSTVSSRNIRLAGNDVLAAINSLKPYPAGDEFLYGIHKLDIADKHRLIVTTAMASDIRANDVKAIYPGTDFSGEGVLRFMTDRPLVIQRHFVNRQMQRAAQRDKKVTCMESKFQPTFQLCFGKQHAFADSPVMETMMATTTRVSEVTELLIAAYKLTGK